MATPYQTVYDAFLSKIISDDWAEEYEEKLVDELVPEGPLETVPTSAALADWRSILENALPYFKFPTHRLVRDENGFEDTLSPEEIDIISEYMKVEWLSRTIHTWENVKVMYDERDWSPANLLKQFISLLAQSKTKAAELERIFYRSKTNEEGYRKSFSYSDLAGK